jgi:integrase
VKSGSRSQWNDGVDDARAASQYAPDSRVGEIGLDPAAYGTHTIRRTKTSLIYRRTKNLRAVQLLLGHTKLESTVRYLGIEVVDALELADQTEV